MQVEDERQREGCLVRDPEDSAERDVEAADADAQHARRDVRLEAEAAPPVRPVPERPRPDARQQKLREVHLSFF